MTPIHPAKAVGTVGHTGYNTRHTSRTSHKTNTDPRDIRRNQIAKVWRVRAAEADTNGIRKSRLFHQFHAAKRRAIYWRDRGYVVTLELAEDVTFRQVWP
jgi:hypothetical protein